GPVPCGRRGGRRAGRGERRRRRAHPPRPGAGQCPAHLGGPGPGPPDRAGGDRPQAGRGARPPRRRGRRSGQGPCRRRSRGSRGGSQVPRSSGRSGRGGGCEARAVRAPGSPLEQRWLVEWCLRHPRLDTGPRAAPSGSRACSGAQLGEPYRWGAAGPGSWDCSGLTMGAWGAAGRSLPHYSVAQYAAGTPIPVGEAKAGDLYFWSSNGSPSGIHHVALALGGGRFIEAPHTGANVRYNSVYAWYPDFAVRL
ncbi:MAG: C40 family peptidase, partial [Nocardioidaceae bacterium]